MSMILMIYTILIIQWNILLVLLNKCNILLMANTVILILAI